MKDMDADFYSEAPKGSPLSNSPVCNYEDSLPFSFTSLVSLDLIVQWTDTIQWPRTMGRQRMSIGLAVRFTEVEVRDP